MSGFLSRNVSGLVSRAFSSSAASGYKVGVVGAAGGIGQPLSMLLRLNPRVKELSLYDVAPVTPGVAADLSHCDSSGSCRGYTGDQLGEALSGCDVVVVPAGVPRKPGMTRDDLFNINAGIVKGIAEEVSRSCPNAGLLIISNPVNSTVPIAAEVLKKAGTYDKRKVIGVTTLDVVRANTFVAENKNVNPQDISVPVIGGHAGITILPLLSQISGGLNEFSDEDRDALTHRIMFGGDEVVQAKAGGGSATLSMAYAAAVFSDQYMKALDGDEGVVQCAYVENEAAPTDFFSTKVRLGKNGVEEVLPMGELNDFEQQKLSEAIPELEKHIEKGVNFVKNN